MRADVRRGEAELLELVGAGVRRRLHAVAKFPVDLADQLIDLALQQGRVGLRPWLLPHALARQQLVDVRAHVRREGKQQRGRRREREAQRLALDGVAHPRGVVEQLHDRRDRGVEGKAAQVA